MTHTLVILALVAGTVNCTMGFSTEFEFPQVGRQLFLFNGTSVTAGVATLITEFSVILGLAALAAIAFFYFQGDDSGGYDSSGYASSSSGSSGYASSSSGYSSRRAKYNPYGFNWESLNILDYISMGQEAWEKYDPTNLECQKRLICEIQQNKSKIGGAANTMTQLFGYLHYAEILSLPNDLKHVLEGIMDASENGRTMQKDCGEVYEGCDFSVNGILNQFSTNKI